MLVPKIITFTANLLAETTYEYASWQQGRTQRAVGESFQVGGKGINVSKMLDRLNAENAALCFPGGMFGPMSIEWMKTAGLNLISFVQKCETRSGTVLRSEANEETTFLGADSIVSEEAIRAAVDALNRIEESFVFALCGSIQGWDGSRWDPLRDWVANRRADVVLVIDNYGPSLPWLADQKPEIVKFNRDELVLLFDEREASLPTEQLLLMADEKLPCDRWAVTDGGGPVWIKDVGCRPVMITPPEVECISPTGCGDVFFATLLDCLYNEDNYDLEAAAKLAADYASRSAALSGIADFPVGRA